MVKYWKKLYLLDLGRDLMITRRKPYPLRYGTLPAAPKKAFVWNKIRMCDLRVRRRCFKRTLSLFFLGHCIILLIVYLNV